jgi:uncharacterized protein involved in exopolysaccharide biosynthesis
MNPESRGQRFPSSEKIYGALLRAYPPAHRVAYGDAMAQLFRDQCRDAWSESKNFGLVKLWLRVLPDLVSTSIMERLAALNERKTMSDKLGNLAAFGPSPKAIFTRVFIAVFLMVVIISVAVTYILPETFASTAMIKIDRDDSNTGKPGSSSYHYDPYFMQTQFEIILSQSVLNPVIEKLHLNETWGKKYFAGEKLKDVESYEILKGRLSIAPVHNTTLAKITVYSEDRLEAAQIANAVAESYRTFRQKVRGELAEKGIAVLASQYEEESQRIKTAQGKVEALRQQAGGANIETSQPYLTAQAELQQMTDSHQFLNTKLKALQLDARIQGQTLVQIVDPAEPGKAPVKPNKTVNITIGAFVGIFAAGIIGGLAALVTSNIRKRRQSANAPA